MPNTFIFNPSPQTIPAEPFVVNGYYPLYFTPQAALNVSPVGAYHEHILNGTAYYMPDLIQAPPAPGQYHGDYPGSANQAVPYDLQLADRNNNNIAEIDQFQDQFVLYGLQQIVPTVTQDILDDVLDPFFGYFVQDDLPVVPSPNDLFIVAGGDLTTIVSLNLVDVHDQYISRGPQNLSPGDNQVSNVFCVYYIRYGEALPIPNYKTLEVMLVERGLTYDAISLATNQDFETYDLSIDGQIGDDTTLSSYDEFIQKMTLDRSAEWNYDIRYRSGYRPLNPFVRDPGDYIRPLPAGATYATITAITPQQRYFERVFQQQTYRERMRDRFEGKMMILDWPTLFGGWDDGAISNNTAAQVDDLVLNLRMMIHGHWKQVTDVFVIKKYAYNKNFDISNYGAVAPNPVEGIVGADGRYGESGLINTLVIQEGIDNIQSLLPEGTTNASFSDTVQEIEPIWNEFPHILTSDAGSDPGDDGVAGLDLAEYDNYIDFESNGDAMFDVTELQPYEPRGSIKYYPENRFLALTQQALQQNQISGIVDQILEYLPSIITKLESLVIAYDSTPQSLVNYVDQKLGPGSPLYNVFLANDPFKVKRKKNNGDIVDIAEYGNFFRAYGNNSNVRDKLSSNQKDNLLSNYQWGLIFDQRGVSQIVANEQANLLATSINNGILQFIADLNDLSIHSIPNLTIGQAPLQIIDPTQIPTIPNSATIATPGAAPGVGAGNPVVPPSSGTPAPPVIPNPLSGIIPSGGGPTPGTLTNPITGQTIPITPSGTTTQPSPNISTSTSGANLSTIFIGSNSSQVTFNVPVSIQNYLDNTGLIQPSNYLTDNTFNCNDRTIREALKQNDYMRTIIFNKIKVQYANIRAAASLLDNYLDYIRTLMNNLEQTLQQIDNLVRTAFDPSQAQLMLDTVIALNNFVNNLQSTGTGVGVVYLPFFVIQATDDLVSTELKAQYNSIQYVRRKVFENDQPKSYFIKWPNSSRQVLLQNVRNPNTLTFDNYIYT
jgi:hypothetical protein